MITIGIVGESGSGKSTIANLLEDIIKKQHSVIRVNSDDYYFDNSEGIKKAGSFAEWAKDKDLDSPDAMDLSLMREHILQLKQGNKVWIPKYDMSGTGIRIDKFREVAPSDFLISEGLFTMYLKDIWDIRIYVQADEQLQKQRWYSRNEKRQLGHVSDLMYQKAKEGAKKHIIPFKLICDIIINNNSIDRLHSVLSSVIYGS